MSASEVEAARAICKHCPVRRDCLIEAVVTGEDAGVWGGYTAPERKRMVLAYDPATPGGPVAILTSIEQRSLPTILLLFDASPSALQESVAVTPGVPNPR